MRSALSTYRLSLDGSAQLLGSAASSSQAFTTTSPDGRYRYELSSVGLTLVKAGSGTRQLLTTSLYAQRPYWSATGKLAFTDRAGGLTRLVVFNPATNTRRVVASHVCGDALVDPWAPDGNDLAVAVSSAHTGCNGHGGVVVAVSDATSGRMRRITGPQSAPIAWTRDGSQLLIATRDTTGSATSRLINPHTGKGRVAFPSYEPLVGGAWSPAHRFFAALATNASRQQVLVIVGGSFTGPVKALGYATLYAWAPRRQLLAIATRTNIRVFDPSTGLVLTMIPAHTPYGLVVQSLVWDHSERTLRIAALPSLGHD
ncbi:MAG: hypothetical protein QOH00_1583 [Gaiellales bacterium]|nr:hypothetical protein [Gaiellales bacterium]